VSDRLITTSPSLNHYTPHYTATQSTPPLLLLLDLTISKRKGMSLEEKRATILNIYHTGPVRICGREREGREGGQGGKGGIHIGFGLNVVASNS